MSDNIINDIHDQQRKRLSVGEELPKQDPEMLYIGCVDARLDPVADIGIEQGRALIFRNIGAVVPKPQEAVSGIVTVSDSIGGVLELFLDILEREPPSSRKFTKKHIVVSGHTHCGGINISACCGAVRKNSFLNRYLVSFSTALEQICGFEYGKLHDHPTQEQLRDIEKQSVRNSIVNLRKYQIVEDAINAGRLEVHGWIIDTATKRLSKINDDGKFVPMNIS